MKPDMLLEDVYFGYVLKPVNNYKIPDEWIHRKLEGGKVLVPEHAYRDLFKTSNIVCNFKE